jgi:hypothetical protein
MFTRRTHAAHGNAPRYSGDAARVGSSSEMSENAIMRPSLAQPLWKTK